MLCIPHILLINPWITDFAAFDFWSQPVGLLQLAALLRQGGCRVSYINCLDRHDDLTNQSREVMLGDSQRFGTGKFPKMPIQTPDALNSIPRRYYRYGIHPQSLRQKVAKLPSVSMVWVSSAMTYWYPGVVETIQVVRELLEDVPIWLGGTYAKLCCRHARVISGADRVVTEQVDQLPNRIHSEMGFEVSNRPQWSTLEKSPAPAYDLVGQMDYAALLSSRGCPFQCRYCASHHLCPDWQRRDASSLFDSIVYLAQQRSVSDFAFHDDALLIGAQNTLEIVLKQVADMRLRIRFHTPNGLHINALTPDWCQLLHRVGFETLRLGLETIASDSSRREFDQKTDLKSFERCIGNLFRAGFVGPQIGVYLLAGLPSQKPVDVLQAIDRVSQWGVQPFLCEYSPIPHSDLWREAKQISTFDLEQEPLFHNNTFFACRRSDFDFEHMLQLRSYARDQRRSLRRGA